MILQDAPRSDSNGIGYTWDESWILPYESILSLMYKFSVLNQISLFDCKTLFKSESTMDGSVTELGCRLSSKKLTRIIGLGTALDRNLVHGIVHPADRSWLLSPYLRSCPICSALGFHSIFHQVMPISKCPIHQENLTVTKCKACGSHGVYDSMRTAAGKYIGSTYACAKCGKKFWQLYDETIDSPQRNMLSITTEQKTKLDALYNWLTASAQAAPYGTNLKRWEAMSGLLTLPMPIGRVPHKKSIRQLRGREIMAYRGIVVGMPPPDSIANSIKTHTTHVVAQYGFMAGNRNNQRCCDRTSFEPQFNDSGAFYSGSDKVLRESLSPVYKSIRRHIAKVFLGSDHQRCARMIEKAIWWEPGPDSNTRICPWAFAYLFWRRYWEKLERANHPNKYVSWKNFLSIKISTDNYGQNEWASLRIFALECYWTFQECVLLARGMHTQRKFGWDYAQIRGRFFPYWYISNQTHFENPSIHWWSRPLAHPKALKLNMSKNQHSRDVAMQAKEI